MHATRALDYLVLDASQRINYKVERGITLQQWYESFKHQPLQGEDMSYREACPVLGVSKNTFYKLIDEGYFGETLQGNGRRSSVSGINRVLEREAYLIPVPAFKEILEQQQYHMGWRYFYNSFKGYFEEGVNKSEQYVSISNAAKIIYELRKRKVAIEEWPTLEDLNRESGLNLKPNAMWSYFRQRIRDTGGQSIEVWTYDSQGKKNKLGNKIPPNVYHKVLDEEKRKKHNEDVGIPIMEIAKTMGLTKSSVNDLVRGGMQLNILHPLIGRGKAYLLIPEESRLVVAKEVPYMITLKRREQTGMRTEQMEARLDQIYPNVQLDQLAEELWYKIKSGDNNAFSILLGLYEPIINEIARNHSFNINNAYEEERRIFLTTALYEIIIESDRYLSKGRVIGTLHRKLRQRRREEGPSWFSLDKKINEGSRVTWSDFVDAEGHLVLR